jgi:hypothetical protein
MFHWSCMKQVPFACLKGNNSYINKKRKKKTHIISESNCEFANGQLQSSVHKYFKLFL